MKSVSTLKALALALQGILTKKFGFQVRIRKGSHVVLAKHIKGEKIVTVIPLHHELKPGTLLGVLQLARVTREEFIEAYKHDC